MRASPRAGGVLQRKKMFGLTLTYPPPPSEAICFPKEPRTQALLSGRRKQRRRTKRKRMPSTMGSSASALLPGFLDRGLVLAQICKYVVSLE